MLTYVLSRTMNVGGKTVSTTSSKSAAAEAVIDAEPLAGNASNAPFNFAVPYARLKSIFIKCTQDCTIKTNSTSSPGDTLTLAAGNAITWDTSMPTAQRPLNADVTILYITNDSSPDAAATVSIFALYDPTA